MFDVGAGEAMVIILVAILILGPARLPGAITALAGWAKVVRREAAAARSQLADAAAVDPAVTETLAGIRADLAEAHPRRLIADLASGPGQKAESAPVPGPAAREGRPSGPAFDVDAT